MKVLVTGGAGYIGSFMTNKLIEGGFDVIVIDSLEEGNKEAINDKAIFRHGNLLDKEFVRSVFFENKPEAVFHFAAYISMKESMEQPGKYFQNNVQAAINLLDVMAKSSCHSFIFSSTAGVYGNPTMVPIPEEHSKIPENPYGESKRMVEQILPWYAKINGISSIILRYFNAAGASLDGKNGEAHRNETHIIPNIIRSVLEGKEFPLYGIDYDTPDGTCLRDYIHVLDLVQAHLLALEKLQDEKSFISAFNVGTGNGYSNKQIIQMVEGVTGIKVAVSQKERRPGDASKLIADVTKIKKELGFEPRFSELHTIIDSAWKWHKAQWDNGKK